MKVRICKTLLGLFIFFPTLVFATSSMKISSRPFILRDSPRITWQPTGTHTAIVSFIREGRQVKIESTTPIRDLKIKGENLLLHNASSCTLAIQRIITTQGPVTFIDQPQRPGECGGGRITTIIGPSKPSSGTK